MSTEITFQFYVRVDSPAGFDVEEVSVRAEFETDDYEHALQLAHRYWLNICPANFMPGTMQVV